MRTPIPVTLVSDGMTDVTVFRVGGLGSFAEHRLELLPGDYVVAGTREGYRDVPHFKTAAELFRSGMKLDAVALCMPPEPRFAIARDALDAGLHVLMEKPPTPTVGELDAITAHAETAGRILFTTWHSQYNKAVDEAQ